MGIIEEHSSNWIVEAMRMRAGISIPLRKLFLLATAAGIFVPTIAEGQILPPEFKAVNDQNIDVLTASDSYISGGSVNITEPIISMYGIENPITYTRNLIREGGWWDSLKYLIDDSNAPNFQVTLGNDRHVFSGSYPYMTVNGNNYIGDGKGNGLGVVIIGGVAYWKYFGKDGMTVLFGQSPGAATTVQYPSGLSRTYYYKVIDTGSPYGPTIRIQSIVQNDGTLIKPGYESNSTSNMAAWLHVTSMSLINQGYAYCDPSADQCGFSVSNWPTATFSGPASGAAPSGQTIIETTTIQTTPTSTGYKKSYKKDMYGRVIGISNTFPYSEDLSFSYVGTTYGVSQVTNSRGDVRTYRATMGGSYSNFTMNVPSSYLGASDQYYFDTSNGGGIMPSWLINRNGYKTTFAWNFPDNHLAKITFPEGNSESFQYDSRFNVTLKTIAPKPGGGGANITEHAAYEANCTNLNTCNFPTSYVDGKGNETDWTYTSYGKRASELSPPAVPGAARRLKLYTYQQKSAYVLNSSGSLVSTGQPIWTIAAQTDCQTLPGSSALSCDPSAARTDTTFLYGADGTADNLLVRGQSISSGGATLVTCYGYDRLRHRISETSPNANLTVCP